MPVESLNAAERAPEIVQLVFSHPANIERLPATSPAAPTEVP